jgi:long-chain acyl-CoA synthetase
MDVIQGLRRAVQLFPDKLAGLDGDQPYSWREFEVRNQRLASGFSRLGLVKGQRVAILMLNRFQYLELYYAIMRAGGVVVPLNTRYAPAEIAYVLEDSEASFLICDANCTPLLEKVRPEISGVKHYIWVGEGQPPAGFSSYEQLIQSGVDGERFQEVELEDEDLAGLFYTGGTTGKAKGVMLTHRNLASNALHTLSIRKVEPGDIWFHVAPMFHLADLSSTFAYTQSGGGHAFLPHFEARRVLETIQRYRITDTTLVPTMINLILQVPDLESYDLTSLRTIGYGAAAMPVELLRQAMQRLNCDFRQGYGQTEASPLVTSLSEKDHREALAASRGSPQARRLASCGRPIIGVEVRVVDDQYRDVKPGEIGEIIVRGSNVMKGYWKLPNETAEALRDGWLHTGDMATIDEEFYIFIVDRRKDMIISGGENIFSLEVENAIYTHPAVLEAAVVGVPDEKWGERVHAVVVVKPGMSLSSEELVQACRRQIAGYKVPRSVEFVENLPKSGAGKILKRNLRQKYLIS